MWHVPCHGSQATLQAHLHAALVLQGLRFDAVIGRARARRGRCVARERGELARERGDSGVVVGLRCDGHLVRVRARFRVSGVIVRLRIVRPAACSRYSAVSYMSRVVGGQW